jgi:hexosaminidase
MISRLARALILLCPFAIAAHAQVNPLMPVPAHTVPGRGSLAIDHGIAVIFEGFHDALLDRARDRFLAQFAARTGMLPLPAPPERTPLIIRTAGPSAAVGTLGEDESYHLQVDSQRILLTAPNPLGVLHGLQTVLQLVEPASTAYAVPFVTIDDAPRFPWRGLMIDVSRHFIPVDVIHQNLDLMEAAKLNVFHWHLSDDQGFRVESKTYRLLTAKGSDGLFYTQAEVRGIVAYAHDRGIRVVPEFDMPGHATSWFVGYPELASAPDPAKASYEIIRTWGIFDAAMDPTRESTFAFLDKFLAEMTALFPDAYFHIGGDECNGTEWKANPRIAAYMQAHQMADTAALQAYFTTRVQALVTKHGKITIGWDEVLGPNTPKDVVIQSWRGQESLAQAARGGNRGILSAGYYLDLNHSAAEHFAVDPLGEGAAGLTPEEKARILGGEGAMWAEFMTPEILTGRIWPRMAAIAERLWSPATITDTDAMYQRLAAFSANLSFYGLPASYADRAGFQRLVFNDDRAALKVLADVVEPTKDYVRGGLRDYTVFTPLNRLVDVVPAESDRARDFRTLATRIASGKAWPGDFAEAMRWLQLWRDTAAQLKPALDRADVQRELVLVAADLGHAAGIGIEAVKSLQGGAPMAAPGKAGALAELKEMEKPKAALLDQIVPSIEILVQATAK